MSAARYVGRVGGLAVAFGVGAAVISGCAIASAATGSAASSRPSPTEAATDEAKHSGSPRTTPWAASDPEPLAAPKHSAASDNRSNRRSRVRSDRSSLAPAGAISSSAAAPGQNSSTGTTTWALKKGQSAATVVPTLGAVSVAPPMSTTSAPAALPTLRPRTTVRSLGLTARTTVEAPGIPPGVFSLALTSVAELAVAALVSIGNVPLSPTTVRPAITLNGYVLAPSSTETVTSIYGQWTYLPGTPSLVQGKQQFEVVEPVTGAKVGTFDALVSRGDSYNYTGLLVTANNGINVGTGAGQVPPVGSVIDTFMIGRVGWTYSAMPSPSGDVISLKLTTPLGDIPIPVTFDAANGIADHTVDNRPVQLANGYSIAPADPAAESLTATSGVPPLFIAVQGHQVFNIFDSTGNAVATFDGDFTTTADVIHTYTQAIYVTANDGINVGTAAGQTPPVGSVFNVVYTGDDSHYVLYSSLPDPSGDVVSVVQVSPEGVSTSPVTFIDASRSPAIQSLSTSGGRIFVPVSALQPVGINGLPPREVQIQGYQQFDAYDSVGSPIGSFDADVTNQWDLFGIVSNVVLVTDVTGGTAGTDPGDVPPVGSIFNFVRFGNSGFGTSQSAIPTASGDVIALDLVTPFGDIPVYSVRRATAERTTVSFFDPFHPV